MTYQTLQIPKELYLRLQTLAAREHSDPVEVIERLVETAVQTQPELDPMFELIGAFYSDQSLIDDISVSEDPDLYLAAEAMGEQAKGLHAWEIAPARYVKGKDGHPIRRNGDKP